MESNLVELNLKDDLTQKTIKVFLTSKIAEKVNNDAVYKQKIIEEARCAMKKQMLYKLPLSDEHHTYNLLLSQDDYERAKNDLKFATELLENYKINHCQNNVLIRKPAEISFQQSNIPDASFNTMLHDSNSTNNVVTQETLKVNSNASSNNYSSNNNENDKDLVQCSIFEESSNTTYIFNLPPCICEKVYLNPLFAKELIEQYKKLNQQDEPILSNISVRNKKNEKLQLAKIENVDSDQDCEEGRYSWTNNDTFMLLRLYKHYEKELSPRVVLNQLYSKVGKEMKKKYPKVDSTKCRIKMDTLKREFRRVKENNEKEENKKITWMFYDAMEELFGKKPWLLKNHSKVSIIKSSPQGAPVNKRVKDLTKFETHQIELAKKKLELKERQYAEKNAHRTERNSILKDLVNMLKK